MCNLSEGFEARGFEKGRAEGRVEGRAEGTLDAIRNLIKSEGWSIERSMQVLNIPETERPRYLELLKS